MSLKQKYLHVKGPFPFNFQLERQNVFHKILQLITTYDKNIWLTSRLNFQYFIDTYKQLYGLTSNQKETLIYIYTNILLADQGTSVNIKITILKLLNSICEDDIAITDNLHFNNKLLLKKYKQMALEGTKTPLKHTDAYLEQLSKFVVYCSKYGMDCIDDAIDFAIQRRDLKYLALFVRSAKSNQSAERVMDEIFLENSLWERDVTWFFIISEITQNFPTINYAPYYQTLFQQIIKIYTTLIDPITKEDVDKILQKELCLGIRSVLKSTALILANLILPSTEPHSMHVWSCVQRIWNIITTSLDHVNLTSYINDFFLFLKTFVKCLLARYRKQKNMYKVVNEDYIEYYEDNKVFPLKLDEIILNKFYSMWPEIIPKLLLFEDGQCRIPKILSDLAMYDKQNFVGLILTAMIQLLNKEQLSMISLYTTKMTIFFTEQFILSQCKQQHQQLLLDCCICVLKVINKLGISQHLDFLELVMRIFSFLKSDMLESEQTQRIVEEIIEIILGNLQAMSIALESAENEQAQIYVDFRNIYFPFLIRLNESQINNFSYRFLDLILEVTPVHRLAYQLITIVLTYINPQFSEILISTINKQLISNKVSTQRHNNLQFISQPAYSLNSSNQQHLKWYTSLIQCSYQHHPSNIIRDWPKLEVIITLLLKHDNTTFFDYALDILYNIIICLLQFHVDPKQFYQEANHNYQTIHIQWIHTTNAARQLLYSIYQKFYLSGVSYLRNKYQPRQYSKTFKGIIIDGVVISGELSEQVDGMLIPPPMNLEVVQEIKTISKVLQIQQTVFGGLIPRLYTSKQSPLGHSTIPIFFQEYNHLRRQCSQYLEWIFSILEGLNAIWSPIIMKTYNLFWKEVHQQSAFTDAINATNQKLSQYFYPYEHEHKLIFTNAFMIVNEAYLIHYLRLQFHNNLFPYAQLINPNFMKKHLLLQLFHSEEDTTHKSYLNVQSSLHEHHRSIVAMFRYKLDPNQPNSYTMMCKAATTMEQKQKYNKAIRQLLLSIKKSIYFFSLEQCIRDSFIRNSVIQILGITRNLQQKKDKKIVLQTFYLKLLFNLELELMFEKIPYLFWIPGQQHLNFVQIQSKQLISHINITKQLKSQQLINKNNQLIYLQLKNSLNLILKKLQKSIERDSIVYMLMLTLYSDLIHISDPILLQILKACLKMCETRKNQIVDMGRTAFFHIIYRFAKHNQVTILIPNLPMKRTFQQYLTLRLLGGYQGIDYLKIKCDRLDSYFYPLKQLKSNTYVKLGQNQQSQCFENQKAILQIINDGKLMQNFFLCCCDDHELKQPQTEVDASLLDETPKSIMENGHKLLNYFLDANPQKIDIFQTFIQNFSIYPVFFYQRLVEKMVRLGDSNTIQTLKQISKKLLKYPQIQFHKLSLYISSEILPSLLNDKIFMDDCIEYFSTCSNEVFAFALNCLYFLFCTNFMISVKIYRALIQRLREQKGSSRLRHLQVLNTFMLAQGRFSKNQAKEAIGYLLKGIQEGSNEIAQAIVTMIISCFIIAINLDTFDQWVQQPLYELIQSKRIYKLNDRVGFEIDQSLKTIIREIIIKAKQQDTFVEVSKNLKIYAKIANQILGSITVHRFNQTFYQMLKDLIMYVVQKPTNQDRSDDEIISQLKDSEYPENIYKDLVKTLVQMEGNTPNIIKKKLKYLEGIVINHSFISNRVQLPDILTIDDKHVTLDHIVSLSNMARVMTSSEITKRVQEVLKSDLQPRIKQGLLMAYVLAAGVKEYSWKEPALKEILKNKKKNQLKNLFRCGGKEKDNAMKSKKNCIDLLQALKILILILHESLMKSETYSNYFNNNQFFQSNNSIFLFIFYQLIFIVYQLL